MIGRSRTYVLRWGGWLACMWESCRLAGWEKGRQKSRRASAWATGRGPRVCGGGGGELWLVCVLGWVGGLWYLASASPQGTSLSFLPFLSKPQAHAAIPHTHQQEDDPLLLQQQQQQHMRRALSLVNHAHRRRRMSSSSSSSPPASSPWPPHPDLHLAYIHALQPVSPTVLQLTLHLLCGKSNPPRPPFSFQAGQWVDFYIKGLPRVRTYVVAGRECLLRPPPFSPQPTTHSPTPSIFTHPPNHPVRRLQHGLSPRGPPLPDAGHQGQQAQQVSQPTHPPTPVCLRQFASYFPQPQYGLSPTFTGNLPPPPPPPPPYLPTHLPM